MILRRITKHVREQNWTAIAIDFVIVVTGVFLGIQLGNWNAERADARDQQALLVQVHNDLAPRLEDWRQSNEVYGQQQDADERFVIDALTSGELDEADRARFDAGLVSLVSWYGIDISLLARRLESTELLTAFQGKDGEDILVRLHWMWTIAEQYTQGYEARSHGPRDVIFSRVFMQPGPYNAPEMAESTPVYDFDALASNEEFRNAAAQLYRYNNAGRSMSHLTYLEIADLVGRLERTLYPDGDVPAILPDPAQ
uniref:hypothetical protein n=1 Tax=uncultured Erythrobacter sp. TaxID=263913 RepID=UPI002636BC85|nr:hypothetical protein [uncultured Erythrobacter sp.]